MLYHHLATSVGDPYVMQAQFEFAGLKQLHAFVHALDAVIERNDILRTSVHWQGLGEPVQVVWRRAPLALERIDSDPHGGDALGQLQQRFDPRHYRLDLNQAPLLRLAYAHDEQADRWFGILLFHHILLDHTALDVLVHEMSASLQGRMAQLAAPVPYRNQVAQTRLGTSEAQHEAFFRGMLGYRRADPGLRPAGSRWRWPRYRGTASAPGHGPEPTPARAGPPARRECRQPVPPGLGPGAG
ncbi:putative polyketide synthase component, partial [Pseudomonas asplenii]